jgi:murein DD-endopeptidase MepM/ murein hydrolase activator NlpD
MHHFFLKKISLTQVFFKQARLGIISLLMAIFLISSFPAHALPEQQLVPGGIALLKLSNYDQDTKVYFNKRRIAVFPYTDTAKDAANKNTWVAMAGIGLSTKPGDYEFSIKRADGLTVNTKITVANKKYAEQHLTIKNKRKVNPYKRDAERIASERIRKRDARKKFSNTLPNVDFIWPISGRISSIFGLRRFFNEQERRPHSGLDIAAPEGTPIKATASGTVIDSGDFFFSGNLVYLDHGQGLISMYAHMSKLLVKPGDYVTQGQIIGEVGETGRVTGPHLHFAVMANRTLIDPIFMLPRDGNDYSAKTEEILTKKAAKATEK